MTTRCIKTHLFLDFALDDVFAHIVGFVKGEQSAQFVGALGSQTAWSCGIYTVTSKITKQGAKGLTCGGLFQNVEEKWLYVF